MAPESKDAASDGGLRVALLTHVGHPHSGGFGVYVRQLSRALRDRGHTVHVYSGPPYPDLEEGIRLIRVPGLRIFQRTDRWKALRPKHLLSLTDLMEWIGAVSGGFPIPRTFGRRVAERFRTQRPDYDVVHDNYGLHYGLIEIMKSGYPVVSSVHHPPTVDRSIALEAARNPGERLRVRRWFSYVRMQKKVAREIPRFITGSQRAREDLEEDFGLPSDRVSVVPYGVPTDRFRPREGVSTDPGRLLTVSSSQWLRHNKGFGTLLEAFSRMRGERPELELVVVGDADDEGRTQLYAQELNVASHLAFVSGVPTNQLISLYNRASVVIVASLYEGFGLPAAEAMACGTPVVATSAGGLPEVVGEAGVLVPPGNPDRLADAVLGLLDDPRRRAELAHQGRRRVERRFQWERTARLTESVYRKMLEEEP